MGNTVHAAFDVSDFTRAFLRVGEAYRKSMDYLVSDKVNKTASSDVLRICGYISRFRSELNNLNDWRTQYIELGVDISPQDRDNLYEYLQNLVDDFLKIAKMYRTLLDETNAFITLPNDYIQKQLSVLYVHLTRMVTVASS